MQVKTKNVAVIALAGLLVVMLWYRVVYSSYDAKASKANTAAQDAAQQATSLEAKVRQLEHANDDKKRQDATQTLNDAIPVAPELSSFLRSVDKIRSDTGVAFQSVTPSAPTLTSGVQTINLGIVVQGEYSKVVGYIDQLTAIKRLIVIDNVEFSIVGSTSSSDTGGPTGEVFAGVGAPPTLQAQLTGALFSQAPALTTPSAGGGANGTGTTPASGNSTSSGPTSPPAGVNNN